ncbi:MAG: hypothetical protein ACLQUT_11220, partial [Thermoleophilia bacterium]
ALPRRRQEELVMQLMECLAEGDGHDVTSSRRSTRRTLSVTTLSFRPTRSTLTGQSSFGIQRYMVHGTQPNRGAVSSTEFVGAFQSKAITTP